MKEWEKQYDEVIDMLFFAQFKSIKRFIQAQIDKAREETAREIIELIEGEGTVEYLNHGEPCEVYEVTPCDIEQLKEKYKGVGYGNSIV